MGESMAEIPGSLTERYDFERELGRGGMATVYLAEERKHGRPVAIKLMRPELVASMGAERFLREIGIAARLSHPHLVPLIDSGDADGVLFYVSAFVAGGSLRERLLRDGRLSIGDAVRVATEVGSALDYAHRAGFVHRDVKPENILFADGHALLADFGVARATGVGDDVPLTEAGLALGTPEYMSPEQASGDCEVGNTSDIYSLGCVVYEMLAGEPPFRAASARAVMAKHAIEAPKPLRIARPDVPASLEAAVMRALAKEADFRFGTVAEFTAALHADELPRPTVSTSPIRSIAVLPFVNASGEPGNEYLSDGLTDELIDALSKLETLRVASRTSVFALKGRPLDVRAIGASLGVSVVLEGTVRQSGTRLRITAQLTSTDDGALLWSQRYDRALEDVFAIQDDIARTILDTLQATWFADAGLPVPKRYTQNVRAYALYLRGRHAWNSRTQEGIARAIEYFKEAIREDPGYALAYTGLADAYALHVDYRSVPVDVGFAAAKEHARRALALDEELAQAHASLAWSLFIHDWDWAGADREYRRAIALDVRYAIAHQWYAFLLVARGEVDGALVEAHTAQDLDPTSVSVRRSLGWIYYYARRYELARHHLARALSMNPAAEETLRVLGLALTMEGKHAEAEEVLREAMRMPDAGSYTLATLGYAQARAGKIDEARAKVAELDRRAEREYVSPAALGTLLLGLGDVDRALAFAERSLTERRGWLVYGRINPLFDPVQANPRFDALMGRLGL